MFTFAVGVLLTGLGAASRSSALSHEQDLLFDARATEIQQAIVTVSDEKVNEFRAAVNFVGTTHPGPIDQYQAFFRRELPELRDDDPGIMVIEELNVAELDNLVEREREIGNHEFQLTKTPSTVENRLIVTRVTNHIDLFSLPLEGLDVTMARESIVPAGLPDDEFQIHIADASQLIGFVNGNAEETLLDELTAVLIAATTDDRARLSGYVVRFDSLRKYLGVLDEAALSNLNVQLWVDGIDRPVGERLSGDAVSYSESRLASSQSVETANLQWHIDVWASDGFGPDARLFAQRQIWVVGLAVTVLTSLGLLWRDRTRQRIDMAEGELAHVRTLAITDGLTGLLNRAGLVDAAREVEASTPAALFFIDLDGFKAVNDEQGHEYGDTVLKNVAVSIKSIFRRDDLVSRLGGDEFVVFTVNNSGAGHIKQISDRITASIAEVDSRITASLGISTRASGDETDVKTMLRTADEAMYEAKRAGGNGYQIRAHGQQNQ